MKSKLSHAPDSDAINQLKISARNGELVAVVGTGISMALTDSKIPSLSWKGLIQHGFTYGGAKGVIKDKDIESWKNQIASDDLDNLLAAAEFLGRKLGAPDEDLYARWLEQVFKNVEPSDNQMAGAIRALHAAGVRFCTLCYDHLLERVLDLTSVNIKETNNVTKWMRRKKPGVLHLHGSWENPSTCILGIRDYEKTLGDDVRDLIQRALASFSQLLFLGCGDTFADPNFSALIRWSKDKLKTAPDLHYALVSADQVAVRAADVAWRGFVEPISYGRDHSLLPEFLLKYFPAQAKTKAGPRNIPSKLKLARRRAIGDDRAQRFYVKSTHAKYVMGEESSEVAKLRVIKALKEVSRLRIDRIPTCFDIPNILPGELSPIDQVCFSMPGIAQKRNEYYDVLLDDDQIFKPNPNNDYTYFISFKLREKLDVLHSNPKMDAIQFEKPLGREKFVAEVHFPPTRKLNRINKKVQLSVHEVRRSNGKLVQKKIQNTRYTVNADDFIEPIPGTFTDMFRLTLLNPPQRADYLRVTWKWSKVSR